MELLLSSNHIFVILALVAFIVVILCFYFGRKSPYLFDTVDEWQEWINQASFQELVSMRADLLDTSKKRPSGYLQIVESINRMLLDEKMIPLDFDNAMIVDDVEDFTDKLINAQLQASLDGVCCLPYYLPKIVIARIPQNDRYGQLLGVQIADDFLICPPKVALAYTAADSLHFVKLNERQLLYAVDVGRLEKVLPAVIAAFRKLEVYFDDKAIFWGLAESDDLSLSEEDLLIAYALYSGHDCSNVKLDEKRALICKI